MHLNLLIDFSLCPLCEPSVSEEGDVVLTPNLSLPEVFELSYHANTLTTSFALESILGMSGGL